MCNDKEIIKLYAFKLNSCIGCLLIVFKEVYKGYYIRAKDSNLK